MSEEEIIEIIEELQCIYKEEENEKKYYKRVVDKAKRYSKALQGLLALYQKEKEKNKDIKEQMEKMNIADSGSLLAEFDRLEGLEDDLTCAYIDGVETEKRKWRDKIKAKIEEYCKNSQKEDEHANCYDYAVYFLQELLEED